MIVGYFSGKQKDFAALMDAAAREMTRRGARVVGRIVQRRGVSDGGAGKMALPYSSRTLLSHGKAREAAALCVRTDADAAVFLAPLTERQRRVLTGMFGCPAVSLVDSPATDRVAPTGPVLPAHGGARSRRSLGRTR
ncbi:hypothetical protein OIB37_32550 [Streptomyces sp. NBC_00820]|uniref:hypothetical protein n=1 Tax=Streptomyces sp. NBC_00820 TaxID=2975842 RepID=UPI002ED3FCD8|nr:hypothetical protein OIB37_32550 [Streptomyces sp. NBC_00820]